VPGVVVLWRREVRVWGVDVVFADLTMFYFHNRNGHQSSVPIPYW